MLARVLVAPALAPLAQVQAVVRMLAYQLGLRQAPSRMANLLAIPPPLASSDPLEVVWSMAQQVE